MSESGDTHGWNKATSRRGLGFLARCLGRLPWLGRSSYDASTAKPEDEEQPLGLTPELLRQIRAIHIRTSRLVDDRVAGEYESAFKGRGMEFEEVREYEPGDDIRTIDWNVTARMDHPYVKTFREERESTVMLLVDVSSSGRFGTQKHTKHQVAAIMAAILAYTATRSNDKVGLILFTDQVEKYIPPKKGRGHVWRVIREVLQFKPSHPRTDLAAALEFLNKVRHRKTVCFVISDFLDEAYQRPLRLASKAHDLIAVSISDPRELSLPDIGFVELEDAETGELMMIDTSSPMFTRAFEKNAVRRHRELEETFRAMNIDHIPILLRELKDLPSDTERLASSRREKRKEDYEFIAPLVRYFRMRERRL